MKNQDPLEALDAYYAAIKTTEAPVVRPVRNSVRFAIPAIGTALGVAAAIAIAMYPTEPSQEATERTVRALAAHQLAAPQPPNHSLNLKGHKPWTA